MFLYLRYIADYNNNRICVFRMADGRFVRKFGRQGNGAGELSYCWSVVLDPRSGQLYVLLITIHFFISIHFVSGDGRIVGGLVSRPRLAIRAIVRLAYHYTYCLLVYILFLATGELS